MIIRVLLAYVYCTFSGYFVWFLANVNSRSRSLYAIARSSVVWSVVGNTRAPYSGG